MILMYPITISMRWNFNISLYLTTDITCCYIFRLRIIKDGKHKVSSSFLIKLSIMVIQSITNSELTMLILSNIFLETFISIWHKLFSKHNIHQ